jgi:replication factor C subunit 1
MIICLWLHRFTAWLGNNSSAGKQRRMLGEMHTRMMSSGHVASDRTGLRTSYLPALRYVLSKPLATEEKEGIPVVINTMQARLALFLRCSDMSVTTNRPCAVC